MREEDKRLLEYDTYFQNSLPAFQEAFISYYGERERNEIEEKFKNALYIPYRDIDTQKMIINELLAQSVSKVMVENNIGVFTSPDKAKYMGGTSYENYRFLVQDFFEEYYETIIICRKKGDMTSLFQKVGQENFDKLNDLINLFNQRFPSVSFLSVRISLYEKKDNEDTRDYYKFVDERNEILESMREYSRKQSLS